MKILILSDLHGSQQWLDYLVRMAPMVDLIAISGDVLHHTDEAGILRQVLRFDSAIRAIIDLGATVAFTTGNHDVATCGEWEGDNRNIVRAAEIAAAEHWWEAFHFPGGRVITPGSISIFTARDGERLLVTTHLYSDAFDISEEEHLQRWKAGARLRALHRVRWLALHHVPPVNTLVGEPQGIDDGLHEMLERYQPDILATGHLHFRPFELSGGWVHRLDKVNCVNSGCSPLCPSPNHVLIDTRLRRMEWRAHHDETGNPQLLKFCPLA